MKSVKLSDYFRVVKPQYVYLRLKPNNSIRNQSTHKIARTIASLHRNITENVRRDDAKLVRILGREFMFGTRYAFEMPSKVSYYIYIEEKRIDFYFVVPTQYESVIREKMSDVWPNVTIEVADELPQFSADATKLQLSYAREDGLSLAVDRRDNDLLNSKLNICDVLKEGDRVGVFYNFVPTTQFTWRSKYANTIEKVKRKQPTDRNKMSLGYLAKTGLTGIFAILDDIIHIATDAKTKQADVFDALVARLNDSHQISPSTATKANASVVDTQIVVMSESGDRLRQRNNAKSLAQSFETITDDNRLVAKPLRKDFEFTDYIIRGAERNKVGDKEAQNFLELPGREVLERYNFIEKVETQETQVPEDLRKGTLCIGVNTFRGHEQRAYLTTDSEYKNLSLIVIGPNRAGKSTFFGNLTRDALNAEECVVLFDYIENCELSEEVASLFPADRVLTIDCSNDDKAQGLGYNEIRKSADPFTQYKNAKLQTSQLETLINSINSDESRLSPKMERYLQSAANVVFLSGGSIKDVFAVLQNASRRAEYIAKVPREQYENIGEYVESLRELDEYDKDGAVKGTKLHLVVGIIDRLNKLKANAFMELMLKKGTAGNIDLVDEVQKAQLIVVKMPETMFPTDNEKDICTTYWMTKLWLAMQVRADLIRDKSKRRPVNFIIDELYQVENTERFLTEKLSRLPKFRIKPIISCHYLGQIKHIREELRSANASYMLIAGCDKKNYNELSDELKPFEVDDLLRLPRYHSMNLIKNKGGYARFITKLPAPIKNFAKSVDE